MVETFEDKEDTLNKAKHPIPQMTKAIEYVLIYFGIIE